MQSSNGVKNPARGLFQPRAGFFYSGGAICDTSFFVENTIESLLNHNYNCVEDIIKTH